MKVKEMTFSKSLKIKAPNYGNQGDIHYSVTVEIEEGDDIQEIADKGWADVDWHLENQGKNLMTLLGITIE